MKMSEITVDDLALYMRIDDPSDDEKSEISRMLASGIAYIKDYTGLELEDLDKHEDLNQALFIIVADMFDNRNLYIEGKASNVNKAVGSILGMHSINLL